MLIYACPMEVEDIRNYLHRWQSRYAERPPVISKGTFKNLQEFLEFRYLFIRFDTDELDYQKTEQKAKQVSHGI